MEKSNPDTLLGDPVANTTIGIAKVKQKGQKDKIGIDDIGVFEFIFCGLPEPPELEGIDEDRLRELQNAVQEQLHQRDEERERNITKRVQEFKKTFDFVNSHLLKGVATMAELTKVDNRQPMRKIKPTDKMVMMLSLLDSTKPATSKQHYERFNLYINFQTKGDHLTDPVGEAINLFEHLLDKTALVWFQTNRSKFKDLTMLKTMFLQFTDVFNLRDEIGTCPFIEVHLKLKDETPFFVRPYPMREEQKKVIQKEMDRLEHLGIIPKGLTGYSSPVVLVKQKNQNLYQVCSDFRILNEKLVKINHAFLLVRDCIEQLGRKKCHYLSTIDLRDAFNMLRLALSS